ncbi:MAG: patatin-like phospholipase family protein, partial [Bacteroidetes bacterium]|nr:patatin-like phospholipase family protein [Bacteroidota bacterium]
MSDTSNKLGIVLCGGGVRGLAQIGVLAALEKHGISPGYISGVSIGAVIGVFYAAGYTPEEMLEISKQGSLIRIFRLGIRKKGLSNLKYLHKMLKKHIKNDSFEGLGKKLFVCASNLNTGKYDIFEKGELFRPVMASAAVPIIFQPQKINDQLYVDGGMLNNFPVEPLKECCDKVIGVFVHNHDEVKTI